ncbi:hypothetical protein [Falsigemmobacter faecalis]|nr:hypothetical protein [Falsigemmobacter faecalis]
MRGRRSLFEAGREHHDTLPLPSVAALVIIAALATLAGLLLWWFS